MPTPESTIEGCWTAYRQTRFYPILRRALSMQVEVRRDAGESPQPGVPLETACAAAVYGTMEQTASGQSVEAWHASGRLGDALQHAHSLACWAGYRASKTVVTPDPTWRPTGKATAWLRYPVRALCPPVPFLTLTLPGGRTGTPRVYGIRRDFCGVADVQPSLLLYQLRARQDPPGAPWDLLLILPLRAESVATGLREFWQVVKGRVPVRATTALDHHLQRVYRGLGVDRVLSYMHQHPDRVRRVAGAPLLPGPSGASLADTAQWDLRPPARYRILPAGRDRTDH